ncbi:MAG: AzlC family ABC transporter permease [Elainellaceae cyanobacterium]
MTDLKTSSRSEFLLGVKTIAPIIVGIIPFGMISGITAVENGLSEGSAQIMSIVVFAGASQLAGVQLMSDGAPVLVIWLTTFMINLRFTMYSASLAPHMRSLPTQWKALIAYILTDQSYALSVTHYDQQARQLEDKVGYAQTNPRPAPLTPHQKAAFYLGISITVWVVWQLSSAVGIFLGASIPDGWSLGFAIPLVFMVLAIPAIQGWSTAAAALTAAILSVVAKPLPFNMGLVIAALAGIAMGMLIERSPFSRLPHSSSRD